MNHEQRFMSSLLLFSLLQSCISIDTITPNRTIADGDLLISKGEIFALGFFSPGNSSYRYLGIWFYKDSEQTVVWVANRDSPIIGTSAVLSIQNGNLLVYGPNQTHFWGTNVSDSSTNIAQLLDSGNLVLVQADTNIVLWQSFDHPTHTAISGMKLGLDKKTGLNRFLTSWKSPDDPGSGNCSYKFDLSGSPQLFLYKGPVRWWRTGPWNGLRWTAVPEMKRRFINTSFVENQDEISAMYRNLNASTLSRLVVDESGSLQWLAWLDGERRWIGYWSAPKDRCDYYGRCGAYGYCNPYNAGDFECTCLPGYEPKSPRAWNLRDGSDGCVRKRVALSTCGNGEGEGFVKVKPVKVPDTSTARVDTIMSMKSCEQECLRNCSCTGYAIADVIGGRSGCVTWYGDLVDTTELSDGGLDLYIRADSFELAQYAKKSKGFLRKKGMLAILVASIVVMLFLVASFACWMVIRKRKVSTLNDHSVFSVGNEVSNLNDWRTSLKNLHGIGAESIKNSYKYSNGESPEEDLELPLFDLDTISAATKKFSSVNKIGEGGFGPVYKGELPTGQEIAVKRLSETSGQGPQEFKNEVSLIAKLQHRNLVKLLGCCIQGEERILIYEYLPNKSLDYFIFDKKKRTMLTWKKCFDIVMGIARGLLYLHQDSRLRIIHRDLKTSNILLDSEMNPKISDFGIARIFGDKTEEKTKRVIGTYGYMSPEYAISGHFSVKSDVFSFGVLVLEIISGQKNRGFCHPDHDLNLLGHAWKLWNEGSPLELMDALMEDSVAVNEVVRCIQVGLLCVQQRPEDRPTMSSVVFMLGNEIPVVAQPKVPGFCTENSSMGTDSFSGEQYRNITNEVTVTELDGR